MKTILSLVYCLLYFANVTFSKGDFTLTVQNQTSDSSNSSFLYYHLNVGSTFSFDGVVHYTDPPYGFYIGAADSVEWFFNNVSVGKTVGTQNMNFNQPGIYSAVGYYGGMIFPANQDIVIAFSTSTGMKENTLPDLSLWYSDRDQKLIICNLIFEKYFSVNIYSLTGKLLSKNEVANYNGSYSIPLTGLSKGIYLVDIIFNEKRLTRKVFVE